MIAGRHIVLPGIDEAATGRRVFSSHLSGQLSLAEALPWPIGLSERTS